MMRPRIPGQAFAAGQPFAPIKPVAVPSPPPVVSAPVQAPAAASDLSSPLQARLAQVNALLTPLLREQSRLIKALAALTED